MQSARSTVSIDNDQVRVTTWSFEPGQRTGPHRHGLPYVVVPATGGQLRLETHDGVTSAQLVAGQPYFREAGAQHDVVNDGEEQLVFVEVEIKPPPQ